MNKITILGSSGQIGAYLTQYFTKKGYLVREFDIANGQHEDMTHIPNPFLRNQIMAVSYTHLTLPTILLV